MLPEGAAYGWESLLGALNWEVPFLGHSSMFQNRRASGSLRPPDTMAMKYYFTETEIIVRRPAPSTGLENEGSTAEGKNKMFRTFSRKEECSWPLKCLDLLLLSILPFFSFPGIVPSFYSY